jgi:hypothetical protein
MCDANEANRRMVSDVGAALEAHGNQILAEAEKINRHTLRLLEYTDRRLKLVAHRKGAEGLADSDDRPDS